MMTLVPRPLDRLRRLRPLDRAALAGLLLVALAGPPLAERAALVLDPALCVALAWERGGGGAPVREYEERQGVLRTTPPPGPLPLDPWGHSFHWKQVPGSYITGTGVFFVSTRFQAESDGSGKAIQAKNMTLWPAWQRTLAAHPGLPALLAAAWLTVAWTLLRVRPRRTRVREVALACLAALPAVPLAWLVASTDAVTRLTADLPLVLPAWLAVALTIVAPWLLLALGVRLVARPEAA